MKILVLNCGSSSIKYQLLDMEKDANLLAKGLIERIGINDGILTHKPQGKAEYRIVRDIADHTIGISLILEALVHPQHGVIKDVNEIKAVGHRVAHGGENFKTSVLITETVKKDIEKCIELAPLHNPANLKGITSMETILPGIKQVAIFDTSFHQTMPAYAYLYGLPYEYYEKYRIRKFGFHGTSHKYVAQKACKILEIDWEKVNIITCHLGNGASVAAIQKGKSVDTSMGFTPVEGLYMGTRAGDLDLGVLLFLMDKEKLSISAVNDLINKKSGMLGISGVSSDMRDIEAAADNGNERAIIARKMYCYQIKKYIGAYTAAMGGVDLIIFTGGVGENDWHVRSGVCENMEYLGVEFDNEKNSALRGSDSILSKPDSKVKVMSISTNEELVIAQDTYNIVTGKC